MFLQSTRNQKFGSDIIAAFCSSIKENVPLIFLRKLASAIYPMKPPFWFHSIKITFLLLSEHFLLKSHQLPTEGQYFFLSGIHAYMVPTYMCYKANPLGVLKLKAAGHPTQLVESMVESSFADYPENERNIPVWKRETRT